MGRGTTAAVLLLLAAACAPAPPLADVSLPPLAEVDLATGAPAAVSWRGGGAHPVDAPARVAVGESERLALLTAQGVAWEMPVDLRSGDRLRLAVAVGEPGRADAAGRLTVVHRRGAATPVGRVAVAGGDGWREEEIAIGARLSGRLRVSSDGPLPVAWAELRVLRGGRAATAPGRPNVVLVSFDTLRADRLSLYGHHRPTSPNLDRFAADALVFDRAFASSTWTLPGHGSLFTGLLPDRHGLVALRTTLDPAAVTLAERLRGLGYRTVALTDGGFLAPRWGLSRGFDRYDTTPGEPWERKDAAVIARRAAAWMEANRFAPYFLVVHSYETHQPYDDPDGFADRWLPPGVAPGGEAAELIGRRPEDLGRREVERIRALYDAGVRRLDHHLGALLAAWRADGRLDDTAVIVTSDHGEELGEHGGFEHAGGKVLDEHVRVPMIVRPPGGTAGTRIALPVTGLDVVPTVLAWAGAADRRLVGRPLQELAATEAAAGEGRRVVVQGISSLPGMDEWRDRLDRGPWTLVSDRRRGWSSFYDRAADPGMERPLTPAVARDDPAVPAVALVARLGVVLAWAAGRSTHAAPLPPAATAVRVDGGGGLAPRGVWDGLTWRPLEPGRPAPLNPGVPAVLAFDLTGRRGGERTVRLQGVEPAVLTLTGRRAWTAEGWNPVDGDLPAVGEIFPTAPVLDAGTLELSDEARRELEALGYL